MLISHSQTFLVRTCFKALLNEINLCPFLAGIALSGYAAALGVGALVLPNDLAAWVQVIEGLNMSANTLVGLKFALAFPATYHTLNGVRHLLWDNGLFLKLNEVYTTGWLMLALAIVSAGALAVY